jgi:16S rRNA (uracil1498-N3)-methyltransferase
LPRLHSVINPKEIKSFLSQYNFIAHTDSQITTSLKFQLSEIINSITLVIGPEGGFTETELKLFHTYNFVAVSLGKRILRCELALIFFITIILYHSNEI